MNDQQPAFPLHLPPLCHPERSRGICSLFRSPRIRLFISTGALHAPLSSRPDDLPSASQGWNERSAASIPPSPSSPFVIPSEAEGSAVCFGRHESAGPERSTPPCHLDRSLDSPFTLLPFCHPERSRGIRGLFQSPGIRRTRALHAPLSSRPDDLPSASQGWNERSAACTPLFHHPPLCHPERSRGICGLFRSPRIPLFISTGPCTPFTFLPFVIPSEAEGSAVCFGRHESLCSSRPDPAPPSPSSPLSSRAKPRDLQSVSVATNPFVHLDRTLHSPLTFLPFVIPSEAEGSAVCFGRHESAGPDPPFPLNLPPLCHPERSRGICSLFRSPRIRRTGALHAQTVR